MDFKVLITDSALLDLQEIVQFVAQDDPAAAARLGTKLIRQTGQRKRSVMEKGEVFAGGRRRVC